MKRISMWFGQPRQLQRVIYYFENLLSRTEQENLRGSYLIAACCEASKADDSIHATFLWRKWLDDDFHDSALSMLAAVERAAKDTSILKEPAAASKSAPVTVAPAAEDAADKAANLNESAVVPEVRRSAVSSAVLPSCAVIAAVEPKSEEPEFDMKYKWLGPDEEPPDGFDKRALDGQLWEIAWALGEGKVFRGCLPKHLLRKLKDGAAWGKKLGRYEFAVYIASRYDHSIPNAIESLRVIQGRGPYHHERDELRAEYKKYRRTPLKCRSEEKLFIVLSEFGVLDQPTRSSLHSAIEQGGKFRGVFDHEKNFVLYLHNDFPPETVEKIGKRLEELKQAP